MGELGDDGRINAVGLSQDAGGAGIVADVPGVEDGEGELGVGECEGERAFVTAGGLEGDQAGLSIATVLDEGMQAGGSGLEALGLSGWVSREIEPILGNVDADAEG